MCPAHAAGKAGEIGEGHNTSLWLLDLWQSVRHWQRHLHCHLVPLSLALAIPNGNCVVVTPVAVAVAAFPARDAHMQIETYFRYITLIEHMYKYYWQSR